MLGCKFNYLLNNTSANTELIDTCWDVNPDFWTYHNICTRINRYMLGCKYVFLST